MEPRLALAPRLAALATFGGLNAAAAWTGARATAPAVRSPWYRALAQPRWQPPPAAFGPAWTLLYGLSTVSAYRVWSRPAGAARRTALGWWGAQLALNAAWSPLFFGARRPRAALADVVALLGALAVYTRAAARVDAPAAWCVAPYLGWVAFAAALNASIVRRNPRLAVR
jgi:tryptophan-rich sensory protein